MFAFTCQNHQCEKAKTKYDLDFQQNVCHQIRINKQKSGRSKCNLSVGHCVNSAQTAVKMRHHIYLWWYHWKDLEWECSRVLAAKMDTSVFKLVCCLHTGVWNCRNCVMLQYEGSFACVVLSHALFSERTTLDPNRSAVHFHSVIKITLPFSVASHGCFAYSTHMQNKRQQRPTTKLVRIQITTIISVLGVEF